MKLVKQSMHITYIVHMMDELPEQYFRNMIRYDKIW